MGRQGDDLYEQDAAIRTASRRTTVRVDVEPIGAAVLTRKERE